MTVVNLLGIFKNNENYLTWLLHNITNIQEKANVQFHCCFYENNSSDNTKRLIVEIGKLCYSSSTKHENIRNFGKFSRTKLLSIIRNKSKDQLDLDLQKTIILDSDIYFDYHIISELCKSISDDVVMVVPQTSVLEQYPCKYYYDMFAFRQVKGSEENNKSLYACDEYHNNTMCCISNNDCIFEKQQDNFIYSGFGGIICIQTNVLKNCDWSVKKDECEHVHFCTHVNEYGKIQIKSNIYPLWSKNIHGYNFDNMTFDEIQKLLLLIYNLKFEISNDLLKEIIHQEEDIQKRIIIVFKAYKYILKREPDKDGLKTYLNYLKKYDEIDLYNLFLSSNEYKSKSIETLLLCSKCKELSLHSILN